VTQSQIEMLEAARRDAMLAADVAALDELLAEEMTWVHASSSVDDKASFLRGFSTGDLRCFRLDHSETTIRLYGSTALVTGSVEMDVTVSGTRRTATNRYACLWVNQDGRFRLVLWQSTRLPPAA
jgi:ketosteroid isomerase-like protein